MWWLPGTPLHGSIIAFLFTFWVIFQGITGSGFHGDAEKYLLAKALIDILGARFRILSELEFYLSISFTTGHVLKENERRCQIIDTSMSQIRV